MQNKIFKNRVFVKILHFSICFKIFKKRKEKKINLAVVEKKKKKSASLSLKKRKKNSINLQLFHLLQKDCENCKSCNSYTINYAKK